MIAGHKSRTALALVLCAVGIAAAWFVYQGLQSPAGIRRAAAVDGGRQAADNTLPVAQEFKLPPLSTFEATLQRPVFSQSRRPRAGAPVVVATQDLALKMLGVTGLDADMRALLVPEGGGDTLQLRVGEEYLGWTLSEIGHHHSIFKRDGQDVRLEMDFKEAPKPVRTSPVRQPAGAQGARDNLQQNTRRQQQQLRQRQQRQQQQRQLQQRQLQEQLEQQQQQQEELQQN